MSGITQATVKQLAWNGDAVYRFAAAFLQVGLNLARRGIPVVAADDVPDEYHGRGNGVGGAAIQMLREAGLIERVWDSYPAYGVFHGERMSKRLTRNGAHVRVWRIRSVGLAEEWLARHGYAIPEHPQLTLPLLWR